MSSPDQILYDLVRGVDQKIDSLTNKLDEKFSDLSPRVTALEVEMRQVQAELVAEVSKRESAEAETRAHKRNSVIATVSAVAATAAAVLQPLIGG